MSKGHRSEVSELYVFSRPKHYKEGPVRSRPLLLAINANVVPVRPNPTFGGRNVVEMLFLRPKPLFTGREDIFAVYQIHFGSQCATESVYWYLPAKVERV